MKKILFISWDGPQTSYMEGLFMPIFNLVAKQANIEFHIIQFTWGTKERTQITAAFAEKFEINYTTFPVNRKQVASIGSLYTMFKGIGFIKNYIKEHNITIVMPRSTMPAIMVNRIKHKTFKICFDADGLPIEERVDFAGLNKKSVTYKILKAEEQKMIIAAQAVLTRSNKAIQYHLNTIGSQFKYKFSVVYNGRNIALFNPNSIQRAAARKELGLKNNELLFVYCGSLGPQYGWFEMMAIFKAYYKITKNSRFLILTGNIAFAQKNIEADLQNLIILKNVAFEKVPYYLNAADIAFAIREPKPSMIGVAPIKLGEYLLMGLPTIASAGIGDTAAMLETSPGCFVYNHNDETRVEKVVQFLQKPLKANKTAIREIGINYFSLEKSAESYITVINKLV